MRLVGLCFALVVACDSDRAAPNWPASDAAEDGELTALRTRAHGVLSARCGSCHESHRPSAKSAAVAVFDLDRPDWPARFDAARFVAALKRLSSAPEPDRRAFLAWRDAELARRSPR